VSHLRIGPQRAIRPAMLLLVCVLGLAGAACSSGSSASVTPVHNVEKSTAINEGDGVCKSLNADQQKLITDFKKKYPQATADQTRDFLVDTLSPRIDHAIGDFHRIGEPTKDKVDWDKLVSNLDKDLTDFKSKISTDPIGLLTAKPFAAEVPGFTAYGFQACQTQLA
jgi:hypothetical protein